MSTLSRSTFSRSIATLLICLPLISIAADYGQSMNHDMNDYMAEQQTMLRGQLRPLKTARLSAGVSAIIRKLEIRAGQKVRQGDVLVEFDCRLEEANRIVAQARLEAATLQHDVNSRLQTMDNASTLEVGLSKADLESSRGELQRIDAILSDCTLRAPFNGTVTLRHVEPFQYVNRGEPMIELIDPERLEIEMVMSSRDINHIKPGVPFLMKIEENGQPLMARVDRIVEAIDPVSQTIRVIGVIEGDNRGLLPGMTGEISFIPEPST